MNRKAATSVVVLIIALSAAILYVPFLGNALIFDDKGLFDSLKVFDYALTPFDLRPRTFPYFTLGLVQVLSGSVEGNRVFSLALHIACCCALFLVLVSLLETTLDPRVRITGKPENIRIIACLGAVWFAIHPIAVYGAGYLVQRTILFATFFSLISLWFYCRSLKDERLINIVAAAFFYSLAVFSKEHAIMLPVAAVLLRSLGAGELKLNCRRDLVLFALCAPAAITVFFMARHVVGNSYEPDVAAMIPRMSDIPLMSESWGRWLVSAIFQMGFFFNYIALWIVPDVRSLSVDMRFDFVSMWFSWWVFPKAFLFFLGPCIATYFVRKKGPISLFCYGFLYCWLLFATELVSVRFQEPFVLYRSYLWAPGYIMMAVAICFYLPRKWLVLVALPLLGVCFLLARERLSSFSTEATLWKDAAQKLSSPLLVGSDRIFYNRGRIYLQEKRYKEAANDFSQTLTQNPKVAAAYYNRAIAYYSLKQYPEAISDINSAGALDRTSFSVPYVRGLILESAGCIDAAISSYKQSEALGGKMAKMKLDVLEKRDAKGVSENSCTI